MSYDVDILLSDEFAAFSDDLRLIASARKSKQEELKQRQEEFKKVYEGLKAEIKELDEQAKTRKQAFDDHISDRREKSKASQQG
jgi:nicotinamide riboside kinase